MIEKGANNLRELKCYMISSTYGDLADEDMEWWMETGNVQMNKIHETIGHCKAENKIKDHEKKKKLDKKVDNNVNKIIYQKKHYMEINRQKKKIRT